MKKSGGEDSKVQGARFNLSNGLKKTLIAPFEVPVSAMGKLMGKMDRKKFYLFY